MAASALWAARGGPALGETLPLVDKTVQVAGFGIHPMQDHAGEFACP
jgi:hypothetical protein